MRVLDITDIARKENAVYYRRYFTGTAVVELQTKTAHIPVEFSIETSPLSEKVISVKFLEKFEYPLVPVVSAVKILILAKDDEGALPL
jgi:hypothetical protein